MSETPLNLATLNISINGNHVIEKQNFPQLILENIKLETSTLNSLIPVRLNILYTLRTIFLNNYFILTFGPILT